MVFFFPLLNPWFVMFWHRRYGETLIRSGTPTSLKMALGFQHNYNKQFRSKEKEEYLFENWKKITLRYLIPRKKNINTLENFKANFFFVFDFPSKPISVRKKCLILKVPCLTFKKIIIKIAGISCSNQNIRTIAYLRTANFSFIDFQTKQSGVVLKIEVSSFRLCFEHYPSASPENFQHHADVKTAKKLSIFYVIKGDRV